MKRPKYEKQMTPEIAEAMRQVQFAANSSMLPQQPYAGWVDGYGWFIDSVATGGEFPSNATHIYQVTVLPERYFS